MRFEGTVTSGRGWAAPFVRRRSTEIAEFLGERPFEGSLNLILPKPVEFDPGRAYELDDGVRLFWQVSLGEVVCLAYRWARCPLHVVELVSHTKLRSTLNLNDGSVVIIDSPNSVPVAMHRFAAWQLLWLGRRDKYYALTECIHRSERWGRFGRWTEQRR